MSICGIMMLDILGGSVDKYIINKKDIEKNFFHFTDEKKLNSISKNGLIPYIGSHSKYIEKSKKVFFVEGLDNLLILFDCWINCWYYMPVIPFIYTLGSHFLRQKWFPQIIADGYFGVLKKSKIHRKRAFKIFNKILDNSILLQLDLEENIDFKYNDFDEIKLRGYKKRHLELMGYSKRYSNLNNPNMDRWNMHTISGKGIESKKIKLCFLKNNTNGLRNIFYYSIAHTKLDLETTCPILYDYIVDQKLNIKNKSFIGSIESEYLNSIGFSQTQINKVEELVSRGIQEHLYEKMRVPYHNLKHIERVIMYSIWILNEKENKYEHIKNHNVLLLAALYHDCGRHLASNKMHGIVGAKIARERLKDTLDDKTINSICLLIETHASYQDMVDFKNYNYSEEEKKNIQILSDILKDADALDRNRIKLFPFAQCDVNKLRTLEARNIYNKSELFYDKYKDATKIKAG